MNTIQLTPQEVNLIIAALSTAAYVSRQHGHTSQADDFSTLRRKLEDGYTDLSIAR